MIGNSLTRGQGSHGCGRRGICAVVVTALVACSALTASIGPASASRVDDDIDILQNVHTGLCLDDSFVGLRGYPCNGLNYQYWYMTRNDIASWH
jgi:hypothetical protein